MGQWKGRKFEDVRVHLDRLAQPTSWKKPAKIFVNSMSDLFHEDIHPGHVLDIFLTMARNPRHIFQVLTKRQRRMLDWFLDLEKPGGGRITNGFRPDAQPQLFDYLKEIGNPWPLKNVWLGVSVENQKAADERIPLLLETPAAVRFLSVEPMLERINLLKLLGDPWGRAVTEGIHWVICGGESGPKARPFNIEWARDLKDQCNQARVPFFMKQMGAKPYWVEETKFTTPYFAELDFKDRKGGDMAEWPEDLRVREFPR